MYKLVINGVLLQISGVVVDTIVADQDDELKSTVPAHTNFS